MRLAIEHSPDIATAFAIDNAINYSQAGSSMQVFLEAANGPAVIGVVLLSSYIYHATVIEYSEWMCMRMVGSIRGGVARSSAAAEWLSQHCARHPLTVIFLVAVGDIGLVALYVSGIRWPIFGEDRALETATALVFLVAFVVGLLSLRRPAARRYPVLLPTASGLGLLGFLDEVGFGARYFRWSMPQVSGGGELDGAHDLVILIYRRMADVNSTIVATMVAVGIAGSLLCIVHWREWLHDAARRIVADHAYSAMALAIAGIAFACLLDLEIGILGRLGPLEEIAELNAALALLATVMMAGIRQMAFAATGSKRGR